MQDKQGQTPLMIAVTTNQPDLTILLLENLADCNIANKQKETPLIAACKINADGMEIIQLLLLNNSDHRMINKQSNNDGTALMIAVQNNNLNLIQFLLDHGADPDVIHIKTRKTATDMIIGIEHRATITQLLQRYTTLRDNIEYK